jgi:hypothetical protein
LFAYVKANPIGLVDLSGHGPDEQALGASLEKGSKEHQDAVNRRRAQKGKKPIAVTRQKGAGGKRETIADEVKRKPGPGSSKTVADTKARHVDSARNMSPSEWRADIKEALEQVKNQIKELQKLRDMAPGVKARTIGPDAKGKVLRVMHDSDKGKSSAAALDEWKNEGRAARAEWVNDAPNAAERALRENVDVVTTTRDRMTRAQAATTDRFKTDRRAAIAKRAARNPQAGVANLEVMGFLASLGLELAIDAKLYQNEDYIGIVRHHAPLPAENVWNHIDLINYSRKEAETEEERKENVWGQSRVVLLL